MGPAKKVTVEQYMVDRIRAFQRSCPRNKRCEDCTERGPTYVCVDYRTFVCQLCSGIHREFGHRTKGISLSQWTSHEVEELERGGNEEAARIWLAKWSAQDTPEPDGSEPELLREFLRKKYVEKRWFKADGVKRENHADEKPPAEEATRSRKEAKAASGEARPQREATAPAPQQSVCDLLTGEEPVSVGAPVAAAPPAGIVLLDLDSAPAAGGSPASAAGGPGWAADFGAASPAPVAAAAPVGSPVHASAPAVASAVPAQRQDGLLGIDFLAQPTSSVASGLLGLDLSGGPSSPPAAAAGDPLLGMSMAPTPEAAGSSAPEVAATPGERLRQALLGGGAGNQAAELNRLFAESRTPVAAPAEVSASARFEALQGNLSSLFSVSPAPMPGLHNVPALPPATAATGSSNGPSPFATPSGPPSWPPYGGAFPSAYGLPQTYAPAYQPAAVPPFGAPAAAAFFGGAQMHQAMRAPAPQMPKQVAAQPPEEPPSPPSKQNGQFGDLLAQFTEKHPMTGFSVLA